MPQDQLNELISTFSINTNNKINNYDIGIGLDCAIKTLKNNMFLIQTTDFFYPLIEDPWLQGRIAAANVLSDCYAVGVTTINSVLMLLGIAKDMTRDERHIIQPLICQGFCHAVEEAGSTVDGGQTIISPWPIIGGVSTSVVSKEEIIMPINATVGDVIILTKPLGTQVAVNVYQWMDQNLKYWDIIKQQLSENEVQIAYSFASNIMSKLNKKAAILMHKYNAHAATDVTGFGILGHAKNLSQVQTNHVSFKINKLPIIKNMLLVANTCGINFRLTDGYSAETSGGLFICLSKTDASNFLNEFNHNDDKAWIIGEVIERNVNDNNMELAFIDKEHVEILEVC